MAQFNPAIQPTNSPSYGANSRPVDVPDSIKPQGVQQNQIMPEGVKQGDRSAEYEGQAAAYGSQAEAQGFYGDLFAGIAGISDQLGKIGVNMVKQDIENRVYNIADDARKSYTEALETIKKGPGVANVLNANASMDGAPEEGDDGGNAPSEVGNLGDRLSALTAARDSNKISNTYYYGRLLAEAKDLRARYPGFREEIDQQFAKVTGVNPANAYIQALVGDINRAAGAKASQQNKLESYVMQRAGYAGSEQMLAKVRAGQADQMEVLKWSAPQEKLEVTLKNRALIRADNKGTTEEKQKEDGDTLNLAFATTVSTQVDNMLSKAGLTDQAGYMKVFNETQAGAINPEMYRQAGQRLATARTQIRVQMYNDALKQGFVKSLGIEEVNKRIDASLMPMDTLIDRVYNKDVGGIYQAQQAIKSHTDTEKLNLYKDSVLGPWATMLNTIKEVGGEQYVQNFNMDSMFGKDKIPDKMRDYADRMKLTFATQPSMGRTGQPTVMVDVFNEMKKKDTYDKNVGAAAINQITSIGSKDTPDAVAYNLALSAFHPNNRQFLSQLEFGGVDNRGRPVPGREAAFQKMTSPEITERIKKLDAQNPGIFKMYSDWAKESFANELFNRDLNDLSRMGDKLANEVKITWDSDNKRFGAVANPVLGQNNNDVTNSQGSTAIARNQEKAQVDRILNRVNSGLYNLKNVATSSGQDVEAYLFQTMVDAGVDFRNVNGIPGKIAQSLIASRFDKAKREAADKK